MPKSILYKHYIILVSAEFDNDTKFWIGKAEINRQHDPKVLRTIIGPKELHITTSGAEDFVASTAKGWIDDHKDPAP